MNDMPGQAPKEWVEDLAIAEAELARGEVVPSEVVHAMIQESLDRMASKGLQAVERHRQAKTDFG